MSSQTFKIFLSVDHWLFHFFDQEEKTETFKPIPLQSIANWRHLKKMMPQLNLQKFFDTWVIM